MTVALSGTSLWSARQGWMASRQQPGSWWKELKNSGAEQRQKASSDLIHPFMVLGKKKCRTLHWSLPQVWPADLMPSCISGFSASPMIWSVSPAMNGNTLFVYDYHPPTVPGVHPLFFCLDMLYQWPLRSLFIWFFSGIQTNIASQISLLSTISPERSVFVSSKIHT